MPNRFLTGSSANTYYWPGADLAGDEISSILSAERTPANLLLIE